MLRHNESRNIKINQVVANVKLVSILFCSIIIFSIYDKSSIINIFDIMNSSNDSSVLAIIICILCITSLALGYLSWINSVKNEHNNRKRAIKDILELSLFIVLFILLIAMSGFHKSPYKPMFLFLITTSTIQFGMSYGLTIAITSSAFILITSLFSEPLNSVNKYFEADLILMGVFILTAWLLGYYSKIEEAYSEQLKDLANMDELTGLYNHRFFQEQLERTLDKTKATNEPFSLLLIDIDNFKSYNDLYGHLEGDMILKGIAHILKNNFRNNDIISRYGGEEFAIILPGIEEKNAIVVAERVRKQVESSEFEGENEFVHKGITISIGISCYPEKAKSKVELIRGADDALYRAKFLNKNRVETYYSILEELKNYIDEEHIDLVSSIKTLISVINAKDHYTYAHTERVVSYCQLLGEKLMLKQEDIRILRYGAYLHDIGKIEIPKEVLNKYSSLTKEEWEMLKQHPQNGAEIIKTVGSLKNVIPLILHHHERYDGTGYPHGLAGDNIPYLARILTIADSFDAMTSNRPYKPKRSYYEALTELKNCSVSQFDPDIVNAFIEVLNSKL